MIPDNVSLTRLGDYIQDKDKWRRIEDQLVDVFGGEPRDRKIAHVKDIRRVGVDGLLAAFPEISPFEAQWLIDELEPEWIEFPAHSAFPPPSEVKKKRGRPKKVQA